MALSSALALVLVAAYAWRFGNVGVFYDGCFLPHQGLRPVDSRIHFSWWPPRFVCLYRTPDGRIVQRSN